MKNLNKKIASLIIVVFLTLNMAVPAFSLTDDILNIKLSIDSQSMNVNGRDFTVEKPYINNGSVMVPLRSIVEAIGAEVIWKSDSDITVLYRDSAFNFGIGSKIYTENQKEKRFSVEVTYVNETTMIPLEFFENNMETKVLYNPSTSSIEITLDGDGALKELSFLIGGIKKTKVGNSYFGWSMNVPKNSQISNNSFNSKAVYIQNEQRQVGINIYVEKNNGIKLEEYYTSYLADLKEYIVVDSSITTKPISYAEFLYESIYEESMLERIFIEGEYIYHVVISSTIEASPKKLKTNAYYKGIIDSFRLDYKGDETNIMDLSKIRFGLAAYDNYSTFYTTNNKYLTWTMDVLPTWDLLESSNPLDTRIGIDSKQYVNISISKPEGAIELEAMGKNLLKYYDENYNPLYYSFISSGVSNVGSNKIMKLTYKQKFGATWYFIEENLIISNDLVYNVVFKADLDTFLESKDSYEKMLETLKISSDNIGNLTKDIDTYNSRVEVTTIGENDSLVDINNKTYEWNIKIPGYWTKSLFNTDASEVFENPRSQGFLVINSIENTAKNKLSVDEAKFPMIESVLDIEGIVLEKSENQMDKNTSIKVDNYRLDNEEEEAFGVIKCYYIQNEKYSYAMLLYLPDLTSTSGNLKEIQDIWNSFSVLTK